MTAYVKFVADFVALLDEAKMYQLGGFPPCDASQPAADAKKILIFSPHPDDECIVGALPLRLMRESGMRVINVAVTHGSNKERQGPRFAELQGACEYLGFGVIQVQESGLEKINPKGKASLPDNWAAAVDMMAAILKEEMPDIVFIPHEGDWNTTHIGTHDLVLEALAAVGSELSCHVVENEFWAPMDTPNVMIEVTQKDLSDLITALSFHVGEVERNPYHLGMPSWMRDNVRRGGELVGGQGMAVPDYPFATLYRVSRWDGCALQEAFEGGKVIAGDEDIGVLFA